MSPEDWKAVVEAVSYILAGGAGLFTAQKVQSKIYGSSSNGPDSTGSATLSAVERIESKLDQLAGGVRTVKVEVEGLTEDMQRHRQDLNRLSSGFREVVGRVDSLEARMPRPM